MKNIVIFGAGKSSSSLIGYLISQLAANDWQLTVLDADVSNALAKTNHAPNTTAAGLDVHDSDARQRYLSSADIVISLLPPALHDIIAVDCVRFGKDLLTASYISPQIRGLQNDIKAKQLCFLAEMGLDPGIDHMSAMKIIHALAARNATVTSFRSHCGGLVAPESDDNPWHYKVSWNPRNVVMAGKAGADFRENGNVVHRHYEELFNTQQQVRVSGLAALTYYPNRDSLSYIDIYGLHNAKDFVRTTLRYPAFVEGWKELIRLGFTREDIFYDTDAKTLGAFFHEHLARQHATIPGNERLVKQLQFLGMDDFHTAIDKGRCSAADVLQFILENKLLLRPEDHDMIVMLHEFEYVEQDEIRRLRSELIVKGENSTHTAMAKTVGLPLGIAAKLILQKKINLTGLHIPIVPEIYLPVLAELETLGITFSESDITSH